MHVDAFNSYENWRREIFKRQQHQSMAQHMAYLQRADTIQLAWEQEQRDYFQNQEW